MPALEHAAPAVGTLPEGVGPGGGSAGGAPFHGLNMAFARSGRAHALIPAETLYSSSPVNGLLFVRGTIGQQTFPRPVCLFSFCTGRVPSEDKVLTDLCLYVATSLDIFPLGMRPYSWIHPLCE